MRLRPHLAGATALLTAACSSGMSQSPTSKPGADAPIAAAPKPMSPARYVVTQSQGATFDEASKGSAVPGQELAIVLGRRAKLEGGTLKAVARAPEGFVGFRSLPERLGGGYLLWTDLRVYHAKDFLGALTPVADIGLSVGVRPWFGAVLLRTDRGIFELSLRAGATSPTGQVKRWKLHPGVVDAIAIDDKRGVTVDALGRVRSTVDGGATWVDASAALGFSANAVQIGKKGEIEIIGTNGAAELRLAADGKAVEPIPPAPPPVYGRRYNPYSPYQYNTPMASPSAFQEPEGVDPISRTLPTDALTQAAAGGLLLVGDRAIVGRESGGVAVISTLTGAEIAGATLLGVQTEYAGCQPVRSGDTILLACAHQSGAEVMQLDGPLASPKLEATFPDIGSFLSDERGHLAYTGRCGRTPPSPDDFGARPAPRRSYEEDDMGGGYGPYGGGYGPYGGYGGYEGDYSPPDEMPEKDKGSPDEKRICVRLEGGHWIEHRLTGDDAKDLFRWVLGDDGEVTALLLEGVNKDEAEDGEGDDSPRYYDKDEPLRRRSDRPSSPPHASPRARTALAQPAPPPPPPPVKSAKPAPPKPPKATPDPKKPDAKKPDAKKPDAKKPEAPKPAPAKDGMRMIRLDPKDRALKKGKWTRTTTPIQQPPWRAIDRNFWLDADGSVRGWMRLGEEHGQGESHDDMGAGDGGSELVSAELGGRFAGVRISPQGKATILPLPAKASSVIFGGPYGMARADGDEHNTYFETTDGGATWTEIEGPPVGELDDVYDESRFPACSAIGCALGSGLARIGWGSPKPAAWKRPTDSSSYADPFPVPRLPKIDCTFDGEPEAFPAPPPKPKDKATPASPAKPSAPTSAPDDGLSGLPPDLQEMIRSGQIPFPPGIPGLSPTSSPVSPPPPAKGAGTAKPKAAKPLAPKPPPAPPAEVISLRTRPQSTMGQLKDKSWVGDVVIPFDPAASVKHVSTGANGLEKLAGYVFPVLGDRGVDLFVAWDKRRAVFGSTSPSLLPFEHPGRIDGAVLVPASGKSGAPAIVGLDESKRALVLVQPDASRVFLKFGRLPEPTRGKLAIARRLDAPGAALVWYSPYSGEVFAGPIDFARAEVGPLAPLAGIATLIDGGLPECTAKASGPTWQVLLDLPMPVNVFAHSGKSLFNDYSSATTLLVRASSERLCIAGAEVRGGGRPLDLTAVFGAKSAAVARSRSSAEDPTKLTLDKLSCVVHEPESK